MELLTKKPRTFEVAEFCDWTGALPSDAEYWFRSEIIVPEQDSDGRGKRRLLSLQNVIEGAGARAFKKAGFGPAALKKVFAKHRETVSALPPELRASATFLHFVAWVDAIAKLLGEGPDYPQWRKNADGFIRSWKKKQTPLDDRILQILAGARAAERDATQQIDAR